MEIATGDAVVLLDGDLQDPPEVIPALYEQWRQGNDVVYGRRSKREGPVVMSMLYRAFYRVFRRLATVPVPLDAGDFSLMDRRVVDELLRFPEVDQFLRGLRAWVGFKQTGVDYLRPERAFGRSTHTRLKNLWWAKKAIFSFSHAPVEALTYLGLTMTVASFLAVVCQLVRGRPVVGALVAFFGSLNLFAVSVVGEYLIRTFDEVKRRPKFIRTAVWHDGTVSRDADAIARFVRGRKNHPPSAERGAG
jgi:dolichol-phosphate mannosyltransferase